MSSLPELTGLIARLASRIEVGNAETGVEGQSDDVLMADLNQSLNLSESSRVKVLDTALSLMCFTAPQVFDSVIGFSVNTIVSVLSSSIDCKLLRFGKLVVLRVGGSISARDCVGIMESCADVLGKLNEIGVLSCSLLYAVLRVAVMTTHFRYTMQLTPILDVQPKEGRIHAISKLVYCMPKRTTLENQTLQMRLLLWYLDSQNLVKDVSQVLQDCVGRPFVCLNEELFEKMEWRSMIICLALSPVMFIETRALLHRWFLLTGLASVVELEVELVSMVLDLLSRPMWWGLSAEVGSKLPFSYAYFLFKHQLFKTLVQPLSCDRFLELVQKIEKSVSHTKRNVKHVETTSMVDHKSTWYFSPDAQK